jgi:hypothetical protein
MKETCLICGNTPEDGFNGLCRSCCHLIKVKSDAFARQSRRRLEEALAKETIEREDVRVIEHQADELLL